jgi:hypothetical protein
MIFSGNYNITFSHQDKWNNNVVRIEQGLFDRLTDFFSKTGHDNFAWSEYQGRFFLKTKSEISRNICRGDVNFTEWNVNGKKGIRATVKETEQLKEILL